jgi:hypothetical protein
MDIRYQRERRHRIRQDLRLLAKTFGAVVTCRGAY